MQVAVVAQFAIGLCSTPLFILAPKVNHILCTWHDTVWVWYLCHPLSQVLPVYTCAAVQYLDDWIPPNSKAFPFVGMFYAVCLCLST